jgi:hypothetical protein
VGGQPGYGAPQQPGFGQPGQPGQPGFGAAPGYAPPPAPKRNLKPWFIGCGGLLLLGLLACGGLVFWGYNEAKGSVDKADEFMGFIDEGDWDSAEDLVYDDCRDQFDLFRRVFEGTEFNNVDLNDLPDESGTFEDGGALEGKRGANVEGTVDVGDDLDTEITVQLVDDGGWQICTLEFT